MRRFCPPPIYNHILAIALNDGRISLADVKKRDVEGGVCGCCFGLIGYEECAKECKGNGYEKAHQVGAQVLLCICVMGCFIHAASLIRQVVQVVSRMTLL